MECVPGRGSNGGTPVDVVLLRGFPGEDPMNGPLDVSPVWSSGGLSCGITWAASGGVPT
jgi:hypothetical protein